MIFGVKELHHGGIGKLKILVTGNLGYIGSVLSGMLLESGHEVVGCDLTLFPKAVCGDLPKVTIQHIKDFRKLVKSDLEGITAVAHLAGISNDPMGELAPGITREVNRDGTIQFAKLAKESGIGIFVFASSCSIYGASTNAEFLSESARTDPQSEYASSKLNAEEELAALSSTSFTTYLLRSATAFGTSPVLRTDLVVNDLSSSMIAYGVATIKSSLETFRPLISTHDMARAFINFIENNPVDYSGVPVNIGFQSQNFSLREIGELIQIQFPHGILEMNSNAQIDPRNYKVDFSLYSRIFPSNSIIHTLESGIKVLVNQLKLIKYSKNDREENKFVRLVEIQANLHSLNLDSK
jgi:nucleoside-diphosphate-sugar epimerase